MNCDLSSINEKALQELDSGNDAAAQKFFRLNAKKYPCCYTLNNLGVYYMTHGICFKDKQTKVVLRLSIWYLVRASKYQQDELNLSNIAVALMQKGNIKLAYSYFLKAYALNPDALNTYNLAACLFRLKKYKESAQKMNCIPESEEEMIVRHGGTYPKLVSAFCMAQQSKFDSCMEIVQSLRCELFEERYDVFVLRYLCGAYTEAMSEWRQLLNEWYPTNELAAMIADCVANGVEMQEKDLAELTLRCADAGIDFQKLVFDTAVRKKALKKFYYCPPHAKKCGYYGCKLHNGALPRSIDKSETKG